MIKRSLFVICYLLFVILSSTAFAQIEFGGYYKNDVIYIIKRNKEEILADVNKLRLRLDSKIFQNLNIHFEPEYVFLIKKEEIPLIGVSELDKVVWDRAYAKITFPSLDLIVGKQRIAWGTGYLFNPTDVFNPFALSFAIAEEERRGVDAVRIDIPIGAASYLEGVILTDKEWSKNKKGVKGKTNIENYDLSLSYVDLGNGGSQVGFDMAGELLDFGVRSELALVSPEGTNPYLKLVLGWNYTFENGWGIDMEYFYNGLGKENKENYDWDSLFAGNIYQLGKSYIYFGINRIIDELTQARASLLLNANDRSFIIYPSYIRNIFENVDLSLEAMLKRGEDGGEYSPKPSQDSTGFLGSNMYFLKLRYSF